MRGVETKKGIPRLIDNYDGKSQQSFAAFRNWRLKKKEPWTSICYRYVNSKLQLQSSKDRLIGDSKAKRTA